ncbi:conserved hypothetical protein [Hyella patelloides LEGE 07179]|uniref:DUF4335 domain-containing protein n=1 Tax=Hyella patelloides LEGE 07179 TaxID=945734 RepID=A0A563VQS9_9CYAN|nr:DUF4335 domain-containing protein [Hyella patelloides]VEP13627.1 conserved hypothetical protein [Hyella patelloides LEGE 07179]
MDSSYTVIRRFTPPTCTLEIWGKNSPLSRWTKQTVVKDIQFKLSFDDPRILEVEPITISGDRLKLEQLYDLVLDHTEGFLAQSFNNQIPALAITNQEQLANSTQPYLTSQGLINHQLNLGSLATKESPTTIDLSATQLFDLVSALEEYKTEMAVLTELETQKAQKVRKLIPIGVSVAGILLAVGLTTVGIKVANQPEERDRIAAIEESQPEATSTVPQEDVIPPKVPEVAEKPVTGIQESEPLSSLETLPPPPAVDTLKPPPNIPDPSQYPPSGNLTIPPISSLPKPNSASETAKSTTETSPDNSQVESTINIPPETAKPDSPEETTQSETQKTTELEIATESNVQTATSPSVSSVTEDNSLQPLEPDEQAEITISEENVAIKAEIGEKLEQAASFDSRVESEAITENTTEENLNLNNDEIALENTTPKPTTKESTIIENDSDSIAPTTRQLQEAASYFRQKWRSQSELQQTLEYRLIINQDGSIKRIIPIGKASEIYLDRTGVPLMGEPFVSAFPQEQSLVIRLLLSPDGEVRTFLE